MVVREGATGGYFWSVPIEVPPQIFPHVFTLEVAPHVVPQVLSCPKDTRCEYT